MKAWIDGNNVLHVQSESVYEKLALSAWREKYEIQNVNGVNMIPSRGFITVTGDAPHDIGESL